MQKGKIQDYESFKNEINILMGLVSANLMPFFIKSQLSKNLSELLPNVATTHCWLWLCIEVTWMNY